MSMDIYYGRARDMRGIMDIERASFTDPWSQKGVEDCLEDPYGGILVAAGEGEILGYAIFHCSFEDCELYNIAVAPDKRRRGVGRELMESVFREARRRGAGRMLLEVRRSNASARALYEGLGFTVLGERKDYYDAPREDAIIMELKL